MDPRSGTSGVSELLRHLSHTLVRRRPRPLVGAGASGVSDDHNPSCAEALRGARGVCSDFVVVRRAAVSQSGLWASTAAWSEAVRTSETALAGTSPKTSSTLRLDPKVPTGS